MNKRGGGVNKRSQNAAQQYRSKSLGMQAICDRSSALELIGRARRLAESAFRASGSRSCAALLKVQSNFA